MFEYNLLKITNFDYKEAISLKIVVPTLAIISENNA